MGIIDVRARTAKGEEIDIEVQLTNQGNMEKRTILYVDRRSRNPFLRVS